MTVHRRLRSVALVGFSILLLVPVGVALSAGGGPGLGIPAQCRTNIIERDHGRVDFSHPCNVTRTVRVTHIHTLHRTTTTTVTTTTTTRPPDVTSTATVIAPDTTVTSTVTPPTQTVTTTTHAGTVTTTFTVTSTVTTSTTITVTITTTVTVV